MLATVIAISSLSITFEDSFAQTVSMISVSQITDDPTLALNGANKITSFKIGSSTYLAVASYVDDGVQILSVDSAGTVSAVSQITDDATLALNGAYGITSFKIGSSTYLAVVSNAEDGVLIFNVSTPGNINFVSQITDDATLALNGAYGITSFKIGSSTYLAVVSFWDKGVQILSVNSAGTVSAVSQITDDTTRELDGASAITSFKIGSSTYLAVASETDDGVQILSVNSAGTVSAVSQITDDTTRELNSARGITSFKIGSSTYLAVASNLDNGVQILSVNSAGTVSAVSRITDDGSLVLNGATGITSFKIGSSTYLSVASNTDKGVQIFSVNSAGTVSAVLQITDDTTRELDGARGITSFKIGSSTYLAVASETDDGVQILKLNQPPTANAGSNQSVAFGSTVTLRGSGSDPDGDTLSYSWAKPAGSSVMLSSTTTQSTTFTAPSSEETITFTLTVSDGTLSDTDTVSITVTAPTQNPTPAQNQPPTANAGRDRTFAPGSTVTLSGSGTDPNGDTLDYTWMQTSGTPVTIEDIKSAQTTFTAPPDPTKLVFTLTVFDGTNSDTDNVTITIANQTRNIKELKDTLVSAQITGSNQITMTYNEELSTFINSYLNFTISGEGKPRNITGINGSPAIETGETVRINGKQVKTYSTTLTFDGEPVMTGSTGSMYIQHADHYLALIQVSDGQD